MLESGTNMKKRTSLIAVDSLGQPLKVSASFLIGSMPRPRDIIIESVMEKMNSRLQWRSVRVALSLSNLSMSRPGEDSLQDLLPLHEIIRVKRRSHLPTSITEPTTPIKTSHTTNTFAFMESTSGSELEGSMHILQICTVDGGHNCGRTYYLRAESAVDCRAWEENLLAAVDAATVKARSGISCGRKIQRILGQFYRSRWTQVAVGLAIVLGFIINIAQSELQVIAWMQ